MIRREVFEELRILDGMIQNATVTYDGETFTYKDVCARWQGECFENDILNLDQIMDDVSLDISPFELKWNVIDLFCNAFYVDWIRQLKSVVSADV